MKNPMSLSDKHILITGASSGIGRATAILASELGAKVSLVARTEERLQETLSLMAGNEHHAFVSDLSDLNGIEDLCKNILDTMGTIDGFIHCAGIGINRPIALSKPDFAESTMRINFYAFLELVRILGKKKFSNEKASFIAVSSVAAIRGDKAQGVYSASKAALCGIIHPMAKELAARSIRVNALAFGMVRTEMYEAFQENGGKEEALTAQYLGLGSCEDAANVSCFLLSNASKFITGTTLVADSGYLS
ncbi:MAG: SDR family oxidoreductase [Christensenella sp.]